MTSQLFRGNAYTSSSPTRVDWLPDHLFEVDEHGVITRVLPAGHPDAPGLLAAHRTARTLVQTRREQVFLPGYVDLHVHAPQWPQAATALDRPLEEWLNTYTFPLEARFADLQFAELVYSDLVATLLGLGTTTAVYFATVHVDSSLVLVRTCARTGQRALIGKVVADDPTQNPTYYRDADARSAVEDTAQFVAEVLALRAATGASVYPVVTPRFVPGVSDAALAGLGELAAASDVHVQSHCSESDWQHGFARDRFGRSDAEVLDGFGLLTGKSVLAHATHLSDSDVALFAERGAAVAHCPLSNAYFSGAVAPIRRYLDAGVKVGLGTDLSGGYSPSMAHAIGHALTSSRMLQQGVDARIPASERGTGEPHLALAEAFWLATAGGGEALSLPLGRLAEGQYWDVQLLDPGRNPILPPALDTDETSLLARLVLLCVPDQIRAVWVGGERVR